jgi:serine kinase of HPr protein (carbohydrate metabolism regulator)
MTANSAISAAEAASAATCSIHASGVAIGEAGIIICGPSGYGKSSLALDLIYAAGRTRRFASLVGDDRIDLDNCGGRLIARGHPLVRGLVEKRGLGILHIPHEPAVVVRLVVDIVAPQEAIRSPEPERGYVVLCGVQLPVLVLLRGLAPYDGAVSILAYLERAGTI